MDLIQQSNQLLDYHWRLCLDKAQLQCVFFSTPSTNVSSFQWCIESFCKNSGIPHDSIYFAEMCKASACHPYSPFLELIKKEVNVLQLDIDELLNQADVYPLHREIFSQYLNDITPKRAQALIHTELDYELAEMQKSFINLLICLSKHKPLFIAIARFEFANQALRELVLALSKGHIKARIVLCCSVEPFTNTVLQSPNDWQSFVHYISEHQAFLSLVDFELEPNNTEYDSWPKQAALAFYSQEKQLVLCQSLLAFLCSEEAIDAVNAVKYTIQNNQNDIDEMDMAYLCEVKAYALSYIGRQDEAFENFSQAYEHAQLTKDPEAVIWAKLNLAWGDVFKYNLAQAEISARKALKAALITNNKQLITACHFALFFTRDRSTQAIEFQQFEDMVLCLKDLNYQNWLSYCYRNYYMALRSEPAADFTKVIKRLNKAIKLAKAIKNIYSVAGAYQIKGIVYSYQNDYRRCLRCLKVCESLRVQQVQSLDVVRIRNSMGYFYLLMEDYDNALNYLNSAFLALKDINDNAEICGTLFNIAWLFFVSQNYERALVMLNELQKFMDTLQIQLLPFRNITDVYAVKAACYAKLGQVLKARKYIEKRAQSELTSTLVGQYLDSFSMALISEIEGNNEQAKDYFQDAFSRIGSEKEVDANIVPINELEFAQFLYRTQQKEQAQQILKRLNKYIKPELMPLSHSWLKNLAENKIGPSPIHLKSYQFDTQYLINMAEENLELETSRQGLRQLNLLRTLQALADKVGSTQILLEGALKLITNNFNLDFASIYLFKNATWSLQSYFESEHKETMQIKPEFLTQLNSQENIKISLNKRIPFESNKNLDCSSFVNFPLNNGSKIIGTMIIASIGPQNLIRQQDVDALSQLAMQLVNLIERFERL